MGFSKRLGLGHQNHQFPMQLWMEEALKGPIEAIPNEGLFVVEEVKETIEFRSLDGY